MNDALSMYEDEKKVISIGACNFFYNKKKAPPTFFIPMTDTLGWATWKDRWQLFEPNSALLIERLKKEKKYKDAFNFYGFYDFRGMLQNQANGKISSWAIRWHTVAYLNNRVTLYPNPSVSQHKSSDSGTHAKELAILPPLAEKPIVVKKIKPYVEMKSHYNLIRNMPIYFTKNPVKKILKFIAYTFFIILNQKKIRLDLQKLNSPLSD
jgi:hypothetical protein